MTTEHSARFFDNLQAVFLEKDGAKRLLELLSNEAMQAEMSEHLKAQPHARTSERRGYRNGSKSRKLKTRVGELELSVPQTRKCEPYHPSLYARWQRSERALLVACAEMYFQGVSTRKVREILEEMCGLELSSMTVSRIASEVDEKLAAFRSRDLSSHIYPYLMVDARYEKVRVKNRVVSQAVLVAVGFNEFGCREVLDWRLGDSESEATWGGLFSDLKKRGLQGVELLISDAHQGILSGMKRHFQGVSWQRCKVHFKREIGKKVSYKIYKELMSDLSLVFKGEDKARCLQIGAEVADKWEERNAKVSKMLREGLEDCLTFFDFPEDHRRRLGGTNMLERLMKTLKQRSRVVGVFPNVKSCDRLIGAVLLEADEKWSVEERAYFNMQSVTLPLAAD